MACQRWRASRLNGLSWIIYQALNGKCGSRLIAYVVSTYLILCYFSNSKVWGGGVYKIQPRNRSRWIHCKWLCEDDTSVLLSIHKLPHGHLLCVVWLARITRGWSNTLKNMYGCKKQEGDMTHVRLAQEEKKDEIHRRSYVGLSSLTNFSCSLEVRVWPCNLP